MNNNIKAEEAKIHHEQSRRQDNPSSLFTFAFAYKTFLLNWSWFILSIFICLVAATIYLRYAPKVYNVEAKVLIKADDDAGSGSRRAAANAASNVLTGQISMSDGFENELEILKSVSIAEDAIRTLKLYVDYKTKGKVTQLPIYKTEPVIVDMDQRHLNKLKGTVQIVINRKDGNKVYVEGETSDGRAFSQEGTLPMTIHTSYGHFFLSRNPRGTRLTNEEIVTISNPTNLAKSFSVAVSTEALSKVTSIAVMKKHDVIPERGIDYLTQFVDCYNRAANEDKNLVAMRTEQFINGRLAKINSELGSTDGAIESFKRNNRIVDAGSNAGIGLNSSTDADDKLAEMNTQILLMQSIREYMQMPENKYQTLPSNVGLTDDAAKELIKQYNSLAINRARLLRSASESSPAIKTLTDQMNDLTASIYRAIDQAKRSMQIQRQALVKKYTKYNNILEGSPEQERVLTQIGRQQTVKSSLYIMLLQKREENSISLAATANKGRLIDVPECTGQISPNNNIVWALAIAIGILFPLGVFILIELTRYRIEGHEEVAQLTALPIISDIALASDEAKSKADIVVHEGKNNHMEEIFRGMRTNLQFMLQDGQNVIMFTSSTSGEGKTFIAANLAVSFGLLGKKTLLVGLDVRRPRLSNLFGLNKKNIGITNLLTYDHPTPEQIDSQIVPSGQNDNLDLLMAGPVPPNPTELVSRPSLEVIMEYLRKKYDYIIIDTAPIGLVTDTLQIGRVADVTCVICRADYTEKSAFTVINGYAENNKLPKVCICINGIDMSKKKYGYAYGYGKYGKYSKYGYHTYSRYGSYYGYNSYGYNSYGYGTYGRYGYGYRYGRSGKYGSNQYGEANDNSIKTK